MMQALTLFVTTGIVGSAACWLSARLVTRLQILDHPNERSSHDRPTPRGGGLGIVVTILAGSALAVALDFANVPAVALAAMASSVVALAGLGWVDDRRGIPPAPKLVVQVAAALCVVVASGGLRSVALPGLEVHLGMAGAALTVLWLVAFTNGFNFMDGIDGIAGAFAGVAGLFLAAASLLTGPDGVVWMAAPVAGASLAFLFVNWSPARVFMGDVGSLPLGFLLALMVIAGTAAGVPFLTGFLVLGPFLFDTAHTLLRRVARRENLAAAHRSHLYQRLVACGWSHARVALLYGGWTVLTGSLGLLYLHDSAGLRALALSVAAASGIGMVLLVRGQERSRGASERTCGSG